MSFLFDRSLNQYISYGDLTIFDRYELPLSGHAWVKLNTNTNDNTLFSKFSSSASNGFLLYHDRVSSTTARNRIFRWFGDDGGANSIAVDSAAERATTGVWHSVGFHYEPGGRGRLYVNGAYEGTDLDATIQIMNDINAPFLIGAVSGSTNFDMNGYVSDVALWNWKLLDDHFKYLARGIRAAAIPQGRIFYDPLNSKRLKNLDGPGFGTIVNGATLSNDEPRWINVTPHQIRTGAFVSPDARRFSGGAVLRSGFIG